MDEEQEGVGEETRPSGEDVANLPLIELTPEMVRELLREVQSKGLLNQAPTGS